MSNIKDMNLYEKILRMSEEFIVAKTGHNDHQHYDYVSDADYTEAARRIFHKYRVVIFPSLQGEIQYNYKNKVTSFAIAFKIVNVDAPKEYETVVIPAQGWDSSDKGVYKANTGAKKYFLALTFLASTGDDAENDAGGKRAKKSKSKSTDY